jgi:coproporphyrinogen III oxidase
MFLNRFLLMQSDRTTIAAFFKTLQDTICTALETADGGTTFREDRWDRPGGGTGRTRVIANGRVLEKGGVNFSEVHGTVSPALRRALVIDGGTRFYATGVSLVLHPRNPFVPITHANVRYFELDNGDCWFGGGIDLTPVYVDVADAQFFHEGLRSVCDAHPGAGTYHRFKRWADDYFYLPHRDEMRGIGGIFFDYLRPSAESSKAELFAFVRAVGEAFAPLYTTLMRKNRDRPYGPREEEWQQIRRGRYAEFNLVIDRGTKFGLDSAGRTESILMSLPPLSRWVYDHQPEANSPEADSLGYFQKGIEWAREAVLEC